MENDKFKNLSEKQKRQKLKFILKGVTQGYLNDSELSEIISRIKVNRQYGIKLYFEANEFENALISSKSITDEVVLGTIVLDEIMGKKRIQDKGTATAVIIRSSYEGVEYNLHIYIPKDRRPKGKKKKDVPNVLCQQNCVDEKTICHHIEYEDDTLFCSFNPPKEIKSDA